MTTIDVQCVPTATGAACAIVVADDTGASDFEVGVTWSDLGQGGDAERLVRETFEFLLEREPRGSIL